MFLQPGCSRPLPYFSLTDSRILAALDARVVEVPTKRPEPPLLKLDPPRKETALDGYKTWTLAIE